MEKKLYQQPKTFSVMMEPCGILCGSTDGIYIDDTPTGSFVGN